MKRILFLTMLFSIAITKVNAQDSLTQKTKFKPSGKISGYLFGDYAYKLHADAYERGHQQYSKLPRDYNSFNIRRLYLQYDYQFSPKISSQLTLAHESSFEANSSKTDALTDKNRSIYVKYANIKFKDIIPRATIVFGQQATPTFARLSEHIWGYRSIEKTIADMRGISSSTDLGVGLFGRIGKKEDVGYDILVGNNNGAKPENNKFKRIYTSFYTYFFNKKLVVQVNYEYNKTSLFPNVSGNTQLFKAFVGYKAKQTTLGVEAFRQLRTNSAISTAKTKVMPFDTSITNTASSGISIFYTQNILPEKLDLFARVDFYNPDVNYHSDNIYLKNYSTNNKIFATLGVDYEPFKNVHIMPNIWFNNYQNKKINATGNLKNDYDLAARLTIYFLFNK